MIYADVYQPPKSASYFNQLPADLFDLATGKGQRRGTIKEAPERISQRDLGGAGADWSHVSAMPMIR